MTDVGLEALDLLTVSEVAARLRCSPKNVGRLVAAGELTRVKMGALVRITPESLLAYKQRLIAEAEAS
jgi:excisionase family DNA binding protein